MTEAQQQILLEGVEVGRKYCDETNLQKESELVDFFKEQGLSIYEADIPAFQEHVLNAYMEDDISNDWDMDVYEQIQALGEEVLAAE